MKHLAWILPFGLCLAPLSATNAADYPVRPIRLIVPFGPGGGTDTSGRLLAQHLSTSLGQTVVVENRPGAAGMLAVDGVAKAAPDGYTLLLCDTSYAINAALRPREGFDYVRGMRPVARFAASPMVLAVKQDLPARTPAEYVALARARPDSLNVGSAGNGSIGHLSKALFDDVAGIRSTHVPYKGSSAAVSDLLAGQIDAVFGTLPSLVSHAGTSRVRLLAVMSGRRSTLAPDLPAAGEAGLAGLEAVSWFGVIAPARTPDNIVTRLDQAIARITQDPAFRQALARQGMEGDYAAAAGFTSSLTDEVAKWKQVIGAARITAD